MKLQAFIQKNLAASLTMMMSLLTASFLTASSAVGADIPWGTCPGIIYSNNFCELEHSNITGQTTAASPLVEDCERLAWNIRCDGRWRVVEGEHRQLAQYGTCAFGARIVYDDINWPPTNVGNQDIIELIEESITWFEKDGRIGASGNMLCEPFIFRKEEMNITWGIYHTK